MPPLRTTAGGSSTSAEATRAASAAWSPSSPGGRCEQRGEVGGRPEQGRDTGKDLERPPEGDEVARRDVAVGDATGDPLEVGDAPEPAAQVPPGDRARREELDRVEPAVDRGRIAERPDKPGAEEAGAHGRDRPVEDTEEGRALPAVADRPDQLEVPDRDRVEDGRGVAGPAEREPGDLGQGRAVHRLGVGERGAGGRDCRWVVALEGPAEPAGEVVRGGLRSRTQRRAGGSARPRATRRPRGPGRRGSRGSAPPRASGGRPRPAQRPWPRCSGRRGP